MEYKGFVCLLMMSLASSENLHSESYSQVLGVLKPATLGAHHEGSFPAYLGDLIPELITASTKIKGYGVTDTLMAYMPFVPKIMAAQSPSGKLTIEQEKLITFTEKVVPPMMKFVEGIYGGKSLTDMPLNETPDYSFTDVMLKLLPDISKIINELKAKYGGWPGTTKSLEILNAFMPLARKAAQIQAEHEGRHLSKEEDKYLTFAERVVPAAMDYSQALYYKTLQSGQEYEIAELVKSAVEDLRHTANGVSSGSYEVQRVKPVHSAHRPASSYYRTGRENTEEEI